MLVSARGVRINVVCRGDGAPVVLLHGLGCSAASWDDTVRQLIRSHQTVSIDLRGFGSSDRTYGAFELADLATDVRLVLERLELDPAPVVAHSMGGMVAQHLCLDAPERVTGLLLCGTTSGPTPEIREASVQLASLAREAGAVALAEAMAPLLFGPDTLQNRPDQVEEFIGSFGSCDDQVLALALDAIAAFDVTARLGDITVPTTVLAGEHDPYLADCRRLAELIPGAEIRVLDGLGHMAPFEATDRFVAEVSTFLGDGAG